MYVKKATVHLITDTPALWNVLEQGVDVINARYLVDLCFICWLEAIKF
jgi:hypothetical protein